MPGDVLIYHSRDKMVPAQRLTEAVRALGYAAHLVEAEGAERMPIARPGDAGAVLVLWSKGAMASAALQAAAEEARRRCTLIEASADGIMPVAALDAPGAALISGWRGEPFHPGWQRIAGELRQICGAPSAAPPPAAAKAAAMSSPAASATPPAKAAGGAARYAARSPAMVLAGLLVLLFAGMGAAAWIGRETPQRPAVAAPVPAPAQQQQPQQPQQPQLPQEPQEAQQHVSGDELQPVAGAGEVFAAPPPPAYEAPRAPARPSRAAEAARPAAKAAASKARPRPAARSAPFDLAAWCAGQGHSADRCRDLRREARRERRAQGERPVRYRNARNMRRFCDGAGRRTPQCRTFVRNTAG